MRRETENPPFNPSFALISGVLAVSTGAIFVRLADAPALAVAAYRVGLASLILAPIALFLVRDELRRITGADYRLAIFAGFILALHFATWVSSLYYTSVASSVVLVTTNPIWVGLLTPFVSDDRLTRATIIGIIISVVGGVIIGAGDFVIGGQALFGDFLALLGGIFMAVYILTGRSLRRKLSLLAYVVLCYGSAGIILWIFLLFSGLPVSGYSTETYWMFLGMALIPQIIGHSSYNWALKYFSASLIAVSLLGEPIGSAILAYFLLGEGVTWATVIGGALILAGIYAAAHGEEQAGMQADEVMEPTG